MASLTASRVYGVEEKDEARYDSLGTRKEASDSSSSSSSNLTLLDDDVAGAETLAGASELPRII